MRVITQSELRTFRRCAREHHYTYGLNYRPVHEAETLRFGTLVHLGLEAWWKAPGNDERLGAGLAAMQSDDPYELARATVALCGYDTKWLGEPLEPLAVEAEFCAPLVNPLTRVASRTFTLGGKLDVVVRDLSDGRVKLVEHKTTSLDVGPGSTYWKRLTLDGQISIYYAGARALQYDIDECLYDVLGKPALRPSAIPLTDETGAKVVLDAAGARVKTKTGKWRETSDATLGYVLQTRPETPAEFHDRLVAHIGENPARYYQRGTVVRLEQELDDAAYDIWTGARLIREAEVTGRHARNIDACERYGRFCSFWPICSGEASLDDATRYRRAEHAHEELTPDVA